MKRVPEPDLAFNRLRELEQDGRLTPDAVLEDATNPESPLHDKLEWDDSVAAHQYRIDQCRTLISGYKFHITRTTTEREVSYYIRDPSAGPGEQGYVSVASLKTDRERAREALVAEAARAAGYLQRVRDLAVALELESEVDAILEQFDAFRTAAALAVAA